MSPGIQTALGPHTGTIHPSLSPTAGCPMKAAPPWQIKAASRVTVGLLPFVQSFCVVMAPREHSRAP